VSVIDSFVYVNPNCNPARGGRTVSFFAFIKITGEPQYSTILIYIKATAKKEGTLH
jgi:hypothetical protein